MDQFVGERAAHEAMNSQMTQTMGAQGEEAMHVALGHHCTDCPVVPGPAGGCR